MGHTDMPKHGVHNMNTTKQINTTKAKLAPEYHKTILTPTKQNRYLLHEIEIIRSKQHQ